MADDNILAGIAGIAGFAEGVRDVMVPYIQMNQKYKYDIASNRLKGEQDKRTQIELAQAKLPMEKELKDYELQKQSQYRQSEQTSEFERENYLNYEDIPQSLADIMGVRKGQRIRRETLAPYASMINTSNRLAQRQRPTGAAKEHYRSLLDNISLVDQVEAGLQQAIERGLNVTGLLSTPINKIKETFGTISKEDEELLQNLRLNFADVARERGGTAFTPTEREVFAPIVPEESKDEKTNLIRIRQMREILERKKQGFEDVYDGLDSIPKYEKGTRQRVADESKKASTPYSPSSQVKQVGDQIDGKRIKNVRIIPARKG